MSLFPEKNKKKSNRFHLNARCYRFARSSAELNRESSPPESVYCSVYFSCIQHQQAWTPDVISIWSQSPIWWPLPLSATQPGSMKQALLSALQGHSGLGEEMKTGAQRFDKDLCMIQASQNGGVDLRLGPNKHCYDSRVKLRLPNIFCCSLVSSIYGWLSLWQLYILAIWCLANWLFQFLMNSLDLLNSPKPSL